MSRDRDPAQEAMETALGLVEAARRALRHVPAAVPIVEALGACQGDLRALHKQPGHLFDEREDELPPPELAKVLELWLAYKAEQHRQRLKPLALQALYRRMREMGPERARAAVEYSIAQTYEGLVEPNGNGNGRRAGAGAGWRGQPPPEWYSAAGKRRWSMAVTPHERKMLHENESIEHGRRR